MKKIFISQPMKGLTNVRIVLNRRQIIKDIEVFMNGEPFEILNTIFDDFEGSTPLKFLSKSLMVMACADMVYFANGWEETRGCKLEHACAKEYELNIIYQPEHIKLKDVDKTIWDLKYNDDVYTIEDHIKKHQWCDDPYLMNMRLCGLVFLTREQAQFKIEQMKIEAELEQLGGTRDMMSLGDEDIEKWNLYYNYVHDMFSIERRKILNHQGIYYFPTKEQCRIAIDTIGEDRLKKYIFYTKGVE